MPWQCRLVDNPDERKRLKDAQPDGRLPPGTMWYGDPAMVDPNDPYGDFCLKTYLSAEYQLDWLGKRLPLWVRLPSGDDCCVDAAYSYNRGKSNGGWTVTGDAPNLTVTPSIHFVGSWHGFLTGGYLLP